MAVSEKIPHVLVIHGPNLNMLGKREPEIYGTETLEKINEALFQRARGYHITLETFQSNHEGDIVAKIQAAMSDCKGLIINPAAFAHTSMAILDALLLLSVPIIEVHLSNIYKREPFRQKSLVAAAATGQISGLGAMGYILALEAIANILASL